MRAIEFLTEARNRMYQYIKSVLPNWPDYVLKDWVYGLARGDHQAGVYFKPDDDFDKWGFNKETILKMVKDSGLSPDTKWQLVPNMKFTMDMFNPKTKQNLIGRAGGSSDLGMGIPRDKERHATQAALAQQQGGVSKEPVLLIKTATGYDLPEGWHRTIQHFHKFPDGYTGPAYIAVAQSKQGVAEGPQEINWVKPNFDFEWHEVEEQSRMKQVPVDVRQYYQKHFPNKDAWLKAVQNGKAVVVPPDHAYEIRNAPFDKASLQKVLAPTGHEGPIGPAKEKRVNDLFDKGQVEMPIILKTSQGLWLIGGKTRLGTANYVKGLPAKVWLISGKQGVAEEKCPHCGGEMVSEELINEKKDACYYKVKSRYKVWPSAYASGALVKCRNKGASNWGNSSKNESSILEGIEQADESLHDWFNKEKWVRMDTKGNIKGPCAKEPGEGKPKCLPQSKAHSLGKKGRASAAARKRREDPNPDRSGKAINVNTKKKD